MTKLIHGHHRGVLLTALAVAIVAAVFGIGVSKRLDPYDADDPSTQSVQAANLFQAQSKRQIDPGVIAIVASGPLRTTAARRRVESVARTLGNAPDVAQVVDYDNSHDPGMVSRDGRSTYLLAYFRNDSLLSLQNASQTIVNRFAGRHDVQLAGLGVAQAEINHQVSHDLERGEMIAFPFVFLLSLLFFRSAVAALLPPLLGGLAILITFLALRIVSSFTGVSVFALNFTTGMGLGLAIDYSLFIVSRYREESALRGFGVEALGATLRTAGRTVIFSSLTVSAAVASMLVFPQQFLYSMGIAGVIVAPLAATLALTVLPAILMLLGPRINALSPQWLAVRAQREARPVENGFWYRLSHFVMRRPAAVAILAAAFLIALAIPVAGIKFVSVDQNALPPHEPARIAQNVLVRDFPAGPAAAIDVVIRAPAHSRQSAALMQRLRSLPNVAAVSPAVPASARSSVSLITVAPTGGPQSASTKALVRRIRALHEPYYVGVSGETAYFIDLEHSLVKHLPYVIAIVVGATMFVLFLMTGSVVLPLKAVLMNALGLAAMFGILVLIFQDGHLQGLLAFKSLGALDATQPVFLFAVGFGLATDYGVFLLSRIKEAHDAGVPNSDAVALGLERTGRIVTAAALLFAVALGSFATSQVVFIKELGLGAALIVLIDASVIRALLVPALMAMLGPVNWWAPRPLRALHQRIGLSEGDTSSVAYKPE